MTGLPGYERAWRLEQALGDPELDDNPLSFASACALDETESFPEAALSTLCDAGLHREYVPVELGGQLDSYEALFWQLRAVGRRDFTAAVAHAASFPPSALVWCAGTEEQRRFVAHALLARETFAIAFHERSHGNDFMASEVAATATAEGYRLDGEKWGVANARRARGLVILAKTANEGGPRGFSLFLVDAKGAAPSLSTLDKIRTHGVRGLDIDGVRFDGHGIPQEALLDGLGRGFERSLACSQLTRTLSLGPLVGALDTALRATLTHLSQRRLYGDSAMALPAVTASIADSFCDLVLTECATLFTTRAVHFAPERLMAWSAATKAFVTLQAERTLSELSVLMGSRFYFRQMFWHGIFEKIVRDAPMARVSHFGGIISLVHLGSALPRIYSQGSFDEGLEPELTALFDLGRPLPPATLQRLRLSAAKSDPVVGSLFALERELGTERGEGYLAPEVRHAVRLELRQLTAEVEHLRSFLVSLANERGRSLGRAPEMFEVARRHAMLFAAASTSMFWRCNLERLDDFGRRGGWLLPALRRVRSSLRPELSLRAVALDGALVEHARTLVDSNRCLSIFAPPVAARGTVSTLGSGPQ